MVRRLTGVHPNTRCSRCKRTAAQAVKMGPAETGIDHPQYRTTYSFFSQGKLHWCAHCHREVELERLFGAMDRRGV